MELFSLLAKLTLDTKEYDRAIDSAKSKSQFELPSLEIGIDKSDFDEAVREINETNIDGPDDPSVTLIKDDYDAVVSDIDDDIVDGPDDPELDLDKSPYDEAVSDVEDDVVDGPDDPTLDMDIEPYKAAMDDANSETTSFQINAESAFGDIADFISNSGIATAVTTIVDSLAQAVDLARQTGDAIDKGSKALGITTDAYQEWDHVLKINGASLSDLNRGFSTMQNFLSGGAISENAKAAFDTLGISARVANGEITSTEQLMEETLKALADFDGDDADRGAMAEALFGKGGGKRLGALFEGTSQDIDNLKQQAHELGLVMTEEEVANAAAYNDSLTNLLDSLDAFKTSLVTGVLPVLTDIFNGAAKIVAFLNWRTGSTPLEETFRQIEDGEYDALLGIQGTANAAMDMYDKLYAMGDMQGKSAEAQALWLSTAESLLDKIPELSAVIDTDTLSLTGNREEVEKIVQGWKDVATQRAIAEALQDKREAIAKKRREQLDKEIEAEKYEAEAIENWPKAIEEVNKQIMRRQKTADGKYKIGNREYELLDPFTTTKEDFWKWYGELESDPFWKEGRNAQGLLDFTNALDPYTVPSIKAKAAREEAAKMEEEIEKATEDLEFYTTKIQEKFVTTATDAEKATDAAAELRKELNKIPDEKRIRLEVNNGFIPQYKKAIGDPYIPFDNFPALLHRGERVLTATEAREQNGGIDYDGLRREIVAAIQDGMADASVYAFVTDRQVGRGANRYNGDIVDAGRYRP